MEVCNGDHDMCLCNMILHMNMERDCVQCRSRHWLPVLFQSAFDIGENQIALCSFISFKVSL